MSCTPFRTIKSRVHHHLMSLPEPLGGPSVLCLQVRVVPPWAPCKASTPDAGWPGNPVVAHDGFDHQHWGKNMEELHRERLEFIGLKNMLDIDVSICFILIFCGLILIFRDGILIFTTSPRALRQLDHQESEELSRYLQTTSLPVSSHAQASGCRGFGVANPSLPWVVMEFSF